MAIIKANPKSTTETDRFNRAPPGYSLAQSPKKSPWEQPPRFNTPNEAVDFIVGNLEKEDTEQHYIEVMFAGISIEEIVSGLVSAGYGQGLFTPDVAEIIKAPLAFYLMGLANKYDVPAKVFKTRDGGPPPIKQNSDSTLLNIMRVRNPDVYKAMFEVGEKQIGEEVANAVKQERGFLGVEEDPGESGEFADLDELEEMEDEE
tara:strand:+ start:2453 stop:3061 length:609 start_codon:yes stop_codon:yes gene_type:complete